MQALLLSAIDDITQTEVMIMKIQCPSCSAVYNISPPAKRASATCKKCGQKFIIEPEPVKEPEALDIEYSEDRVEEQAVRAQHREIRESTLLLVLRDTGIILGMVMAASVLLVFLNLYKNGLVLLAGSFVAYSLGFFICGHLRKIRKLEHSLLVALIVWLVNAVVLLISGAGFRACVVHLVLICVSAAVGLSFSKLLKREPSSISKPKISQKKSIWKYAVAFGVLLFLVKSLFDMLAPK